MGRRNLKQHLVANETSIKKSNELSMAKLNQGLTLNQMQLLAYAIYYTQQNGITEFKKSEFEQRFDIGKYLTEFARKDSKRLLDLKFSIEDLENDYFEYWNVFQSIRYNKGVFNFKWTEDMIPHILELKDKYYVSIDLATASQFKSSFSWSLYEYLKANYGFWYKNISKDGLMSLFGVEDVKSYQSNTSLFKKRVLDTAINEINIFTELEVRYEEIKKGRTITGFKLIWSTGTKVPIASKKQMEILELVIETILDDFYTFINLKNSANREEAIRMVRETESMRKSLVRPISISSDYCKQLTDKANIYLDKLNEFLVEDKQPKRPSKSNGNKDLYYNWLET